MSTAQLKDKYREVFGEETRSNHKHFLLRRIQADAWGGPPNAPAATKASMWWCACARTGASSAPAGSARR